MITLRGDNSVMNVVQSGFVLVPKAFHYFI